MEVRQGYKRAAWGQIPQEWDTPYLGDIFIFKNGLNKAKEFFGRGTPIVNYMDVYRSRRLNSGDLLGRVTLNRQELNNFEVRKGDVFFTRTSETAAEVGITSVMLDDTIDTVFSGFVLRARPKDNSLVDQFKKYCFSTIEVRRQITSQSSETTRALTNGRSLAAVSIARPTKVEQEAIAEALSDADALIESLEQLIAKKHLIKQGAMQELLTGKKRLPVFEVKPGFKKSEVGLIPEDWLISKIDDFCVVIRGASPRPKGDKRFYGGSIPRLMVEDVTRDGKTVIPQIDFLTEEGVKRSRPCKKGTLTIVCSGTVGIPSFLGVDACIHDGFLALVSIRKSISDEYLYHQLCRLRESFESSATHGGIFTNLTTSGVREFKLLIPSSKDEQDAIATILSDMDSEIIVLETKLNKALQVKQGMMQELLTGRIRLV